MYEKIKPHANALAFILGFIWDNFMLSRIDHRFANIMLGTYLFLSFVCVLVLNMHEAKRAKGRQPARYTVWLTPLLQFCFGSLFSAYIIFYTRSASLAVNWPFLVFLVLLVFGNEIFRKQYSRPPFQLAILFIVLFSYAIFSLPVFFGVMGPAVFLLSGLVSLAFISLTAYLVARTAPERFASSRRWFFINTFFLYSLFNYAYFTNIIPPVPLALKEIGVYHSVLRGDNDTYRLVFEPGRWYPLVDDTALVYRRSDGKPVYVFGAVFAPTRLSIPIFHRWQKFDESKNEWSSTDVLQFPIVGGRDDGYRGYSLKRNITDGLWRVDVETLRRELIGRVEFEVVSTTTPPNSLVTEIR